MNIRRSLAVMICTTVLIGALGTGVGYTIGRIAPNFYRNGRSLDSDPIDVGIGRGLVLGTVGGVMAGLTLVLVLCWRETQLVPKLVEPEGSVAKSRMILSRIMLLSAIIIVLSFGTFGAFFIGALVGTEDAYHRECENEWSDIGPVLGSDADFRNVKIDTDYCDGGWISLSGSVRSRKDLIRLREKLSQVIGQRRAEFAVSFVKVE